MKDMFFLFAEVYDKQGNRISGFNSLVILPCDVTLDYKNLLNNIKHKLEEDITEGEILIKSLSLLKTIP